MDTEVRRKTRLGRRWEMVLGLLDHIIHFLRKALIRYYTKKNPRIETDLLVKKRDSGVFT